MKRRHYIWTSGLVVAVILGGLSIYDNQEDRVRRTQEPRHTVSSKSIKRRVHLYFSDEANGYLVAEERALSMPEDAIRGSKKMVQALIDGHETDLRPTIPVKTNLLALYVTSKGVAYVDFNAAIRQEHSGGTLAELATIFSVVNTLCLNIADIHAVKILIEGREEKTLSGHIDIQKPFKPNLLMLKE